MITMIGIIASLLLISCAACIGGAVVMIVMGALAVFWPIILGLIILAVMDFLVFKTLLNKKK